MKKLLMRKNGIVHTVRESDKNAVAAKKAAGFEVIGTEETEADEITALVNEAVAAALDGKVEATVNAAVDAKITDFDKKIASAVADAVKASTTAEGVKEVVIPAVATGAVVPDAKTVKPAK